MSEKFDIEQFPTSPTALRMLSRVSPIYDKSYVGKWIFQIMGLEMGDIRLRFEELRLQAFPETATWGLVYWEQRYNITPSPNQTIEERRQAVIFKRTMREPMNPGKVEYIVENMTGFSSNVTENVEDYTFAVEIFSDGGNFDFDAVLSKLKRIKPSHQKLLMYVTSDSNIQIKTAADGHTYHYPLAGTRPETNTLGQIEAVTVEDQASGTGSMSFRYPLCGENDF